MEQIRKFSDTRLDCSCIHCGGSTETRDHVPSKILLDAPYPDNIPVVPSCSECNNRFSLDEEYAACLIECNISGSTNPVKIKREKIKQILIEKPKLAARISKRKEKGGTLYIPEEKRIRNFVLKLARGHVAFENSQIQLEKPVYIWFKPLQQMSNHEVALFTRTPKLKIFPEVGSRAFQRILIRNTLQGIPQELITPDWLIVQQGRYRYSVTGSLVRIVLSEYLACAVSW